MMLNIETQHLTGKRLIHRGKGNTLLVDALAYVEPAAQPKPYNAPRQRLKSVSRLALLPDVKAHTNYKPGFIWQIGDDQCRDVQADGRMCGCKITRGRYCAAHAAINYRGKA